MEINDLAHHAGEWLSGKGDESEIVISSRIRLARNLADYPFVTQATEDEKGEITDLMRRRIEGADFPSGISYIDLLETSALDDTFLVERHLISRELAQGQGPRAVAFSGDEVVSIMVNEEDHLRVQVLKSGLALDEAWAVARTVDDELEGDIAYAFSPQFGYLTACPTNVGTGMRASVMVHLPALVYTKQIEKVFQAVAKINLTVRGLYGEGTQASGDFYQISNQVTLGVSENGILENIIRVVPKIIEYERSIREHLVSEKRTELEDRVWRAYGTLTSARLISSAETMEQLSLLRLGVNVAIVQNIPMSVINELFVLIQPAHLQKLARRPLESRERDEERARYVRTKLVGTK